MHNDVSFYDIEESLEPRRSAATPIEHLRGALLVSLIALGGILTVAWVGVLLWVSISNLGLW